MVLVPLLLVLKQPDLGTAIMLLLTSSLIVMLAGIHLRSVLIVLITGLAIAALVFAVSPVRHKIWGSLKPYQQNRIKAFVDPSSDPLGSGYHANQSKIAVGSGQITGKGYRKGTQSQMAFLPERHTDFIFAVIAEETGLRRLPASCCSCIWSFCSSAWTLPRTQRTGSALSWPAASSP